MNAGHGDLDRLFASYAAGDAEAFRELVTTLYDELKRIARGQLRRGRPGSLQTTALVHEAYLKLASGQGSPARDREHFFALCARAMRHLVVDQARAAASAKRGGGAELLPIDTGVHLVAAPGEELSRVDDALERLERVNPRHVRLVELRVFAGFTEEEIAELTGSSLRTVQRDWQRARAWLRVELGSGA
jgi:RNA polymerase sigma factor (TIGR02999 family)